MGLETVLSKLLEGTTPLDYVLITIIGYFVVREFNAFNSMKNKLHEYDSDIIVIKKDVNDLKSQLEKLDNEHRELHPRKGGKRY